MTDSPRDRTERSASAWSDLLTMEFLLAVVFLIGVVGCTVEEIAVGVVQAMRGCP